MTPYVMDNSLFTKTVQLRLQVWEQLFKWNSEKTVINLLGYVDYTAMKMHYNEEDVRILKLLLGPNGWAVYKMLLLKQDLIHEPMYLDQ